MKSSALKKYLCLALALVTILLCGCGAKEPTPAVDPTALYVDDVQVKDRDLYSRVFREKYWEEWALEHYQLNRFISYMNRKATTIGMYSSQFNDAAGMHNISTARDLLRLVVYAKSYPQLDRLWSQNSHTVTVTGDRVLSKDYAHDKHQDISNDYVLLQQKGGSMWLPYLDIYVYNLAAVIQIPDSEDQLIVVALYAEDDHEGPNNSRLATKQVADIAMALYNDPAADVSKMPVCCENAIAAVLPAGKTEYADLQLLYERNADMLCRPMSISKLLTAVCVLDHVEDLTQQITFHELDTKISSFYTKDYLPGDKMTYEDALYALLLGSSNVTAQALARSAGAKME